MRTLTKVLAAGAVSLAALVPGGIALADDGDQLSLPVCTAEQRQSRDEAHDRMRAEMHDQLREDGVIDPDHMRGQLRARLHDAMQRDHGDMPGPHAGPGARP